MSIELSRRCTWLLWLALAASTAAGLLAAPAFDPLAWLHRQGLGGLTLAATLHGLMGIAAVFWLARRAGERLLPPGLALVALGLLAMALSLHHSTDARLLLWLDIQPLCWWLAAFTVRPPTVPTKIAKAPTDTPCPRT